MSILDLAIFAVVILSTLVGVWRGFIREILSLGTWVIASLVAWLLASPLSEFFEQDVTQPTLQLVAAFIAVFIIMYIIGTFVTFVVHRMFLKKPFLKMSNYLLGGVVGIMRGGLIVIMCFLLAGLLPKIPNSSWWKESELAPYFEVAAVFVGDFLPRDIARHIRYD